MIFQTAIQNIGGQQSQTATVYSNERTPPRHKSPQSLPPQCDIQGNFEWIRGIINLL